MRKYFTVLNLSTVFVLSTIFVWSVYAVEDGGQPGAFLSYGAGARALGMGKTFVGVADDASTVYWNPAGLGLMKRGEVTTLYASLYENTGFGFIGYAHPLRRTGTDDKLIRENNGVLGLAVVSLDSKGFQLRDEYNYEMGEGGVNETAVLVSYGRLLLKKNDKPFLSVGASFKGVRQIVDSQSAASYGADIGALCAVTDNMNAGLCVQNVVAPRLKIYQATDEYPLSVTVGAGCRLLKGRLLLASDVNKTAKRGYKLHFGGEYTFLRMFSFRAGIDENELACGIGFKLKDYSIDYAFALHDAWHGHNNLGTSHRIGLTIKL